MSDTSSGTPVTTTQSTPSAVGSTGMVSAAGSSGFADPQILTDFGLRAEQIAEVKEKYSIPSSVEEKFPDLVALLLKTESMNAEEREYWFQVLPIMNDDQIVKLRTILVNERDQLKKIDADYDDQMKKLGDSHKKEWNAFEANEKKKARMEVERQHEEAEKHAEEDLLRKLQEGT